MPSYFKSISASTHATAVHNFAASWQDSEAGGRTRAHTAYTLIELIGHALFPSRDKQEAARRSHSGRARGGPFFTPRPRSMNRGGVAAWRLISSTSAPAASRARGAAVGGGRGAAAVRGHDALAGASLQLHLPRRLGQLRLGSSAVSSKLRAMAAAKREELEAEARAAREAREARGLRAGDGAVVDVVADMLVVDGLQARRGAKVGQGDSGGGGLGVGVAPWTLVEVGDGGEGDGGLGLVVDLRASGEVTVAMLRDGARSEAPHVAHGAPVRVVEGTPHFPVTKAALGRVVDPLGNALDGGEPLGDDRLAPVFGGAAPGVSDRDTVVSFVPSGWRALDAFYPIGRGRSTVISATQGTSKSELSIDIMANQVRLAKAKGEPVMPMVYVIVGRSTQAVAHVTRRLQDEGIMEHTALIVAPSTASAGLQFMAPFSGIVLAERFATSGQDALIVYDELSAHASASHQLSAVGSAPPNHGLLLGRCAQFGASRGGGSLTALALLDEMAPMMGDELEVSRREALVERIVSHADDAIKLVVPDFAAHTGQPLPISFEAMGKRYARPFQPVALRSYVGRAQQLMRELSDTVVGARKAIDLGIDPETEHDDILDFHTKFVALLAPDRETLKLVEDAAHMTREELTRKATTVGRAMEASDTAVEHATKADTVLPTNREALLAARDEKRRNLQAAQNERQAAIGSKRGATAVSRSPSRGETSELVALLFALTHGYVSPVPVRHILQYQDELLEVLDTMLLADSDLEVYPHGCNTLLDVLPLLPEPQFATAPSVHRLSDVDRRVHTALLKPDAEGHAPLSEDARLDDVAPIWKAVHAVVDELTIKFVQRIRDAEHEV